MSEEKPGSLRYSIRHFTPSWFAASMGTGVIVSLLHNFPYGSNRGILDAFAAAFLLLNTIFFTLFTIASIVRYIMFPEVWTLMIHHPVQSLFVGCYPMAFATIITGGVIILSETYKVGGARSVYTLWAFWWIDVAMSVLSNFGMLYMMITRQKQPLESLTAVWLLPIVPAIVAASTGCLVAGILEPISVSRALLTYEVSAVLVLSGLSMSLMIITVYIQRLITQGFPKAALTISVLLPLGPLGQGGYALLLMGQAWKRVFPTPETSKSVLATPGFAVALQAICFAAAVALWVLGIWFIIPSLLVLRRAGRIPFAMPWWGMVFPTGVYAVLTLQLAKQMDSSFLRVMGTIYTLAVFTLWTGIATRTVYFLFRGSLFHAPCLDDSLPPTSMKSMTKDVENPLA